MMKLIASALLACVASAENACEAYQECMNEGHLDPEQCQKEYGNYAWYADENLKEMCIIPPTDDVYSLLTTPRPMMPNSNCPSDHLFRHETLLFIKDKPFEVAQEDYDGPSTSFKVRGPGSVQTMKVGEYIQDTIDFIATKGLLPLANENEAASKLACGASFKDLPSVKPFEGSSPRVNFVTWNILESKLADDGFVTEMKIGPNCADADEDNTPEAMLTKYKEGFAEGSDWQVAAQAMMDAAKKNKNLIKAASAAAMNRAERDKNGAPPTTQELKELATKAGAEDFIVEEGGIIDEQCPFAIYKKAFETFSKDFKHDCLENVAPGQERYKMIVKIAKEKLTADVMAFQEYDKKMKEVLDENNFEVQFTEEPQKKFDAAVAWNKDKWTKVDGGCVFHIETKKDKCKCMWVGLEQKEATAEGTKKKLLVASMHLTSGKKDKDVKERKAEMEAFAPPLIDKLADYDAFVIGADANGVYGAELLNQYFRDAISPVGGSGGSQLRGN